MHVKSPVGLRCDIAVLIHRVVKEYIALHSQPGESIEIIATLTHQHTVLVVGTPRRHSSKLAPFLKRNRQSLTSAAGSSPQPNHCEGNSQSITLAAGGNRNTIIIINV